MRLFELSTSIRFPRIPARSLKRRKNLILIALTVGQFLQLIAPLRSISTPYQRINGYRMGRSNDFCRKIAHASPLAVSLEKDSGCDPSDVMDSPRLSKKHHGILINMPSSVTDDDTSENYLNVSSISSAVRKLPRHVAFVCDGNTRWAASRNLPASMGHAAGANRTYEIIRYLQSYSPSLSSSAFPENPNTGGRITHATFYAFSTENWNRPSSEIREIFTVIERTAQHWYSSLSSKREVEKECHIVFKTIGDLYDVRIPKSLRSSLLRLEDRTQEIATRATSRFWNTRDQSSSADHSPPSLLTICVAINYGGRQDIVTASKRLLQKLLREKPAITEEDVDGMFNETSLSSCLDTASIPDPDLLIRTSGESRLSNFLLWNMAYTELYFTDSLWPDFDGAAIEQALCWYSQRERRYGKH